MSDKPCMNCPTWPRCSCGQIAGLWRGPLRKLEQVVYECDRGHAQPGTSAVCLFTLGGSNMPCGAPVCRVTLREAERTPLERPDV